MAYCVNQDVVNEFKSIDVVNGKITTAKIDVWISEADAYIDGRIGTVYTVPVTGSSSILILKNISIGLVAQRIAYILETKAITPKGDQYVPKNLIIEAEKKLTMIVNRQLILSDADEASSTGGVSSYTSENTVQRVFHQERDDW